MRCWRPLMAVVATVVALAAASPARAADHDKLMYDPVEQQVHAMSVSLHRRLLALGIPHTWDDYGPGTHSWPYWQRDLRQALPSMMSTLGIGA